MADEKQAEVRLVERARAGERAAQEVLWHTHRRWVAAIVLAHRPRQLDVEDLMQDVACKFVDKLSTLRDPGAFRPWLRQIILNVCRGAARSLRPDRPSSDQTDQLPDPHDRVATAETKDAAERLLGHVLTLPPEYREPMLLRCVRSMTYQQISDLLGLPVTTVETRLARARRMLRDELSGDAVELRWGIAP